MAIAYAKQNFNKYIRASVNIPYHLRNVTNDKKVVELYFTNIEPSIKLILDVLIKKYPKLAPSIVDEDGKLSQILSVYVNDKNIKQLKYLDTRISAEDNVIYIRPALAGG